MIILFQCVMTKRDRYFEDFAIGESGTVQGRTITETDVNLFAGVTGDAHPIHVNEEYANESRIGGRTAQMLLVHAIASGQAVENNEHALPIRYDIQFERPVRIGDTIDIEWEVTETEEQTDDHGLVTISHDVVNQDDERVMNFALAKRVDRGDG